MPPHQAALSFADSGFMPACGQIQVAGDGCRQRGNGNGDAARDERSGGARRACRQERGNRERGRKANGAKRKVRTRKARTRKGGGQEGGGKGGVLRVSGVALTLV